jgi:hypothetical protein
VIEGKVDFIEGKVGVIEGKFEAIEKEIAAMKINFRNELVDMRRGLKTRLASGLR